MLIPEPWDLSVWDGGCTYVWYADWFLPVPKMATKDQWTKIVASNPPSYTGLATKDNLIYPKAPVVKELLDFFRNNMQFIQLYTELS